MRILFILDEFLPENSGGAANVAFWLAKGLVRSGYELMVLTTTYNEGSVGDIEIDGVKIKRILSHSFGRLRNFRNLNNKDILAKVEKVLAEYKPDIIHIHALHHRFSYGVINLAKRFSKAVFLTLHDAQTIYNGKLFPERKICDLNPEYDYKINWFDRLKKDGFTYNPFQRFFIKRALKKADKIFAVSRALKEAIEANGIRGIEVIHNGINFDEWQVEKARDKIILFLGRVDKSKGADVLVKIFGQVQKEVPGAKLLIVGDKDFKAPENKNIEILPWLDWEAVRNILKQTCLIAVPSLYLDPFPTVNLEAMAAGKPVVGTCFGGTPEIVVNGETGYIVNPYNEKELADKIIDLLKNPEKAAAFGKAGRVRVEKFFSLEKQVQKTLFWYTLHLHK